MKIKTVKIPIYFGNLKIIIADDLKDVMLKYKLNGEGNYDAFVWWEDNREGVTQYFVAVSKKNITNSIIAHESVHIVNLIFKHRGIELDIINDEPQAYLTGWVFRQIENFVNKNKIEYHGSKSDEIKNLEFEKENQERTERKAKTTIPNKRMGNGD